MVTKKRNSIDLEVDIIIVDEHVIKITRTWCSKCKKWMYGDHLKDICENRVL